MKPIGVICGASSTTVAEVLSVSLLTLSVLGVSKPVQSASLVLIPTTHRVRCNTSVTAAAERLGGMSAAFFGGISNEC